MLLVKNDSFPETDDILRFQQPNSQHFSSKNNKKHTKKQPKRPKYRVINKYVKSKKKYWRERNRRKKVWELSGKLTYKQIAEKLGISEKTVQRDMKKISPYYIRLSSKYLRELKQERNMNLDAILEGRSFHQQFKILTDLWIKHQKLMKYKKYVRHLLKVIIDMDDVTEGCPRITIWPRHWSGELPIHLRFIVKYDEEKEIVGELTLERSRNL
jgi:hypothetical protein